MFSLKHIYDFQPSLDSSPPNPMLKFISDKYQFQYLRELWSSIAVIAATMGGPGLRGREVMTESFTILKNKIFFCYKINYRNVGSLEDSKKSLHIYIYI